MSAAQEAARWRRERDEALRKKGEAFDRAVRAERERDAAVARAEAAEARTAAAVSRADVERVVHRYIDGGFDELHVSRVKSTTDAFMALLSGDDPPVFVVRESDVASVNVERHGGKWVADGEAVASVGDEPARARGPIAQYMKWTVWAEAVARAIAAEAAVDPVEARADELAREIWKGLEPEDGEWIDYDDAHKPGGHDGVRMVDAVARYLAAKEDQR